jgi:hypothetical protein
MTEDAVQHAISPLNKRECGELINEAPVAGPRQLIHHE